MVIDKVWKQLQRPEALSPWYPDFQIWIPFLTKMNKDAWNKHLRVHWGIQIGEICDEWFSKTPTDDWTYRGRNNKKNKLTPRDKSKQMTVLLIYK